MADEDDDLEQPAGLRPFWSGTITFGLVTVPVALFTATRPRGVSLRMIEPETQSTIQRRYVCSKDEEPLDNDDIVRGYEIEKGKFVVVTDYELSAIEPRKSREIDLRLFVDRDEIDPMYFERAYFLVPAGGTNKAYRLLAEAMQRTKQAGIATFVMRAKEYLVAILAENGILRAETLRFADDLRSPEDVGLDDIPKPAGADVKKFEEQIARHTKKQVDLHDLLDDYTEQLEKLVAQKEKKGDHVIGMPEESSGGGGAGGGGAEVVDLLQVLSRSLGEAGAVRKSPKKTTTTAKRSSGTKRASSTKRTSSAKRASGTKRAPTTKARKTAGAKKR
ncbi:MAG: Ku protein [Acidobacteria bacterium]|nr:Ku protein [Acidobacteriota bacterium]MBV9478434.1 Ku protein [Acidobacteriota bacterium]